MMRSVRSSLSSFGQESVCINVLLGQPASMQEFRATHAYFVIFQRVWQRQGLRQHRWTRCASDTKDRAEFA